VANGPARGRVLLIHGLSSIANSWWRVGSALAARGWDVTAVDQAGHGGRPVRGEITPDSLAGAIREVYPEGPDVLIGHSLGTVTAFGLLEHEPGWARTVILEEPASTLAPDVSLAAADSVVADVAAARTDRQAVADRLRRECPLWAEEDIHWAVRGLAELDPMPFARRFTALALDRDLREQRTPDRIIAAAPSAYVLAGVSLRATWSASQAAIAFTATRRTPGSPRSRSPVVGRSAGGEEVFKLEAGAAQRLGGGADLGRGAGVGELLDGVAHGQQ
jgi:pimeloyl-ACP methyl ester carboxylesterase